MTRSQSTTRKSGPRRLYQERRLCVQRYHIFQVKQEEPFEHRQGNEKQVRSHHVRSNRRKVRATAEGHSKRPKKTDGKMLRQKMQEGLKDREVVTPPRKKAKEAEEEMSNGIR